MRKFKIILGGLMFAVAVLAFSAASLAIAGPLPGFEGNNTPIPTPVFRPITRG